jgi:transcriptional regulator with XRE-family HTH domain
MSTHFFKFAKIIVAKQKTSCYYITEVRELKCGEKIKHYRESLNMSQAELARLTGYAGRSAISRIENGERDLSQDRLKLFAKVLRVDPVDLLDDREPTIMKMDYERLLLFDFVASIPSDQLDLWIKLSAYPAEKLQAIVDLLK